MTNPEPPSGHLIENPGDVATPALLVYPERVTANIKRMVAEVGSTDRLRPHVKTHKSPDIVSLHQDFGIRRFKCATTSEARMLGGCRVDDVVLALQPVGPNIGRLVDLVHQFPGTRFSTLCDNVATVHELGAACRAAGVEVGVWLDIDCGMHRTGIAPPAALPVYREMASTGGLLPRGLHAYDGHLSDPDPVRRRLGCEAVWEEVVRLRHRIEAAGLVVPGVIAGGTPTFPFHAARAGVECSPGTTVLWDAGYAARMPEFPFLHAAFVLTRVVSQPAPGRFCFDLGHKAVASENPMGKRVRFIGLGEVVPVAQSEEHLVVEAAADLQVGDVAYGIPWHICPTVALYDHAEVIRDGRATDRWPIVARSR